MKREDLKCPKCNSDGFITMPNRYNILKFVDGKFEVEKSEFTNEKERIFCRDCSIEIDETTSLRNKKVVLKNKLN